MRRFLCLIIPLAAALLLSCATNRGVILENLDDGLQFHYTGRYADSSRALEIADRAIEEAYTKSLSAEVATYIVNDRARPYAGEDYENIYLNAFNALNYYQRGNLEEAVVEVRRMTEKLQGLEAKYASLFEALPPGNADAEIRSKERTRFNDSALARYLGLLFYRAWGNRDDARIDAERLSAAFRKAPEVYPFPVPASVAEELNVPPGMARLNVLTFVGLGPVKVEDITYIQLSAMGIVKIALPVLVSRPTKVTRVECAVTGGETFNLSLLEDMEAVARETFKNKAGFIYAKTIIRASLKAASGMVLTDAARNTKDESAALVMGVLGMIGQINAVASEGADTRGSQNLPAKAYIGGITVKPGAYTGTVNFYSGDKLLESQKFTANLTPTGLHLIEASCLK